MPLNSFALRASKRSQIVADIARLNRRQLHGRTASGALRTLVLCIEHALLLSDRRSEFTREPTGRFRFQRVRRNDANLDVIAFGAFEQPLFETNRSRRDSLQHHSRPATRTAKALNSGQEWLG
jgi:hypothetical protein